MDTNQVTIQRYVDLIGNYIVKNNISNKKSVTKSFGECEIKGTRYQIQVTLVPYEKNWNSENGVLTYNAKRSWITKILNGCKYITDAGKQK